MDDSFSMSVCKSRSGSPSNRIGERRRHRTVRRNVLGKICPVEQFHGEIKPVAIPIDVERSYQIRMLQRDAHLSLVQETLLQVRFRAELR